MARAGVDGGSRGGGMGGGSFGGYSVSRYGRPVSPQQFAMGLTLAFLIVFTYPAVISYLYFVKGKKSEKRMANRKTLDDFWDHAKIIDYAEKFYFEIQEHWSSGSLKNIEHELTASCFRQQQNSLNRYKKKNISNHVEDITIHKSMIVYFDDYTDNSMDSVAVMMEGYLKDYFGAKEDAEFIEREKFRDVFVFMRKNNGLLLHEIINDADKYQIATAKNTIE